MRHMAYIKIYSAIMRIRTIILTTIIFLLLGYIKAYSPHAEVRQIADYAAVCFGSGFIFLAVYLVATHEKKKRDERIRLKRLSKRKKRKKGVAEINKKHRPTMELINAQNKMAEKLKNTPK